MGSDTIAILLPLQCLLEKKKKNFNQKATILKKKKKNRYYVKGAVQKGSQ